MMKGYIILVLQAHLPFVRHPDYENFLEEKWLFEAISETYLPLLRVFRGLEQDGIPFKLTVSISPTLAAMLTDDLLQARYVKHLKQMLQLAESEMKRTEKDPELGSLARMYHEIYSKNYGDFTEIYQNNILKGFQHFQKKGHVELITSAATHCFFPLFQDYPETLEAQIQTGISSHHRIFGKFPQGVWIPECGYFPGLEKFLKVNGVKYFFAAAHGVMFADETPKCGVYAPLMTPNGLAVFGRDPASTHAVWSSEEGYPGDFVYRDFYRDIGFDLPLEYISPYIHEGKTRVNTGFKYYAITGKTDNKRLYQPAKALKKVQEHADNFIYNQVKLVRKLSNLMDREPAIVCPYDAELFGHWWFEGPAWIDALLRKLVDVSELSLVTPVEYLELYPQNQVARPSFSSWGKQGYAQVWLDGRNDWIYPHLHKAIERMKELAHRFPNESGLKERALNQAAREVLLSQASDWPFIMKMGTTVPYATKRIKEHIYNFTQIYEGLCRNVVNTEWLTFIERKNNIFPDIDYRVFKPL